MSWPQTTTLAAHYQLGLLASESGDSALAVQHLEAALQQAPDATRVHHALATAYRQQGNETQAAHHQELAGDVEVAFEDRLTERLEDLAISSGAYLRRGNRALTSGQLDGAASAFRRAIQINPDLVDAHRNLALTHVQKNELDAALEVLREAVQRHPSDLWLRFDLGTTYMAKGFQEQAIEAFQVAVEMDPSFTQAHFNLANALIAREQWEDAKPHLDQVLEQDPEDGRARYLHAMALHKTGNTPQAIEALEQQVGDTPDDIVARQGLAQVYTDLKRDAEARRVYTESIARETLPLEDRLDMSFQLAELEWRKQRRNQAIQVWRQAVKLDPKSSEARTALGNGLQLLNRWPRSSPALRQSRRARPRQRPRLAGRNQSVDPRQGIRDRQPAPRRCVGGLARRRHPAQHRRSATVDLRAGVGAGRRAGLGNGSQSLQPGKLPRPRRDHQHGLGRGGRVREGHPMATSPVGPSPRLHRPAPAASTRHQPQVLREPTSHSDRLRIPMRPLLLTWTTCLAVFALACSAPSESPSSEDPAPSAEETAPVESQTDPETAAVEPNACPAPRRVGDGDQQIALVVSFGDGHDDAICIAHDQGSITAYAALQQSGLEMASQYHAAYDAYTLCRLTGSQESTNGCSYPDEDCFCDDNGAFWSFWRFVGGEWVKSQTGLAGVQLESGELFAQHWSGRGDSPPACTFDQVCGVE